MKVFIALAIAALFLNACSPFVSASAQEPQRKEAVKTEKTEVEKKEEIKSVEKREVQKVEKTTK